MSNILPFTNKKNNNNNQPPIILKNHNTYENYRKLLGWAYYTRYVAAFLTITIFTATLTAILGPAAFMFIAGALAFYALWKEIQ